MAEMTREEEALNRLRLIAQRAFEAAIENRHGKGEEAQKDLDAIDFAIATTQSIAALRQGWVRTAERVPTAKDGINEVALYLSCTGYVALLSLEAAHKKLSDGSLVYPYWMPLPPLPEVEA